MINFEKNRKYQIISLYLQGKNSYTHKISDGNIK